uniref:Uncharacterized protein n=1 Tax=Anguilla anguilla TaxID=7936 RepID=A0A0E9VVD6_ANGAN
MGLFMPPASWTGSSSHLSA